MIGLSRESLKVLSELRGEDPPTDQTIPDVDMTMMEIGLKGDEDGWEDQLDDEGSFAHAVRDIMDSRYVISTLRCKSSLMMISQLEVTVVQRLSDMGRTFASDGFVWLLD